MELAIWPYESTINQRGITTHLQRQISSFVRQRFAATYMTFMNCHANSLVSNQISMKTEATHHEINPEVQRIRGIQVRAASKPLGAESHPSIATINQPRITQAIELKPHPPYSSAVLRTTIQ